MSFCVTVSTTGQTLESIRNAVNRGSSGSSSQTTQAALNNLDAHRINRCSSGWIVIVKNNGRQVGTAYYCDNERSVLNSVSNSIGTPWSLQIEPINQKSAEEVEAERQAEIGRQKEEIEKKKELERQREAERLEKQRKFEEEKQNLLANLQGMSEEITKPLEIMGGYSVRDNGAVLRHCREGKKPRSMDNIWTFGKPNDKNYLTIATEMIHRIVATAFHGDPPTIQHIVDHIDTNRHNNRPENLQWFTKLENILRNPVTRKKIEFICGCSAEEFLANPAKHREKFENSNYAWMRNVSEKEAETCLKNFQIWAKSDNRPASGSLGEWVYQTQTIQVQEETPDYINSLTLNAVQRNWQIPTEFPCCPQEISSEPLASYAKCLKVDSVFCRNNIYTSFVYDYAITNDGQSLLVLTRPEENSVKSWALAKITFENNLFVHTSIRTFFTKEGAEKQFTFEQGLEWKGGDSIDDYC